ncbi:MAG: strawberry notch family protein [Clostridia bacterium]|nr:strawberry notch family protein [Clostridia bacterium]
MKLTEAYRAGVQRAIESQEGYGEVQGAIRHLARVSRGGTAPITGSVSRREDLTDDEREALKVKQAEEDERFRLEHPERVSDELADTDTGRILTRLLALDEDEAADMLGAFSGTAEKALSGKSGYIANPMLNFATGIMDTANMVPEVRNIAQDIKTEGAYTREASVISDFMSKNPVYREKYMRGEITKERLLSLINRSGADVSRENLNWWLAANSSAMRDALVYERTDGVADGYKKIVGGGAKSIGRMVIPLMAGNAIGAIGNAVSGSSAVAGSASVAGSSGGLIGSIIARKSLGEILRNALSPSVSKVIMSIGAGTSAFNENANAGAGVGANAAYSTLSSFSEYLAEGLFGLPSAEAFGSSGNTVVRNIIGSLTDGKVTGNTVKVLLQNLAQYAVNAGEEGLEEGVTNILNGLVSKITVSPDKQWFGDGGVFDFRQIGIDVASGAFVGAVMGSVGVITSSVAQCLESGDIRGAAEVLNTWAADHLDERYRPADLDPKTATAETVKAHHEMILEAYARQIEDADRAEAEAEVSEHLTELVEDPADEHIVEETEVPSEEIAAETPTESAAVPVEETAEASETAAEAATEEVRADEAPESETAAEESHGAEEGISAVTSSAEAEVVGPGGMTLGQVIPRFRAMGEAGFSLIKTINEAIRSGIIFAGVSKETMHRLIVAHAEGLAAREVKKSNVQDPREDARNSSEKPEKETVTTAEGANGDAFTITDNAQYGTLEIKFDGKPSEAVRNVLKAHKFRWHGKKGIWYGKADRSEVEEALREAYLQDKAQTSQSTVQNAENPVDSTEKGKEDTGKSQIGDTMEAEDRSANANADAPSMQVASYFLDRFRAGVYPNKKVLEEKCAKAFGGTLAEGAYTPKDAYDALELAVNLYLKELARDFNTDDPAGAVQAVAKLEELVGNLPTQTNRTSEQEKFQQFSTPPTIAYLAAWVANVKASDVVLEPSAGIGGLAVYPKAWGATVAVNELDERRRGVLSHMGFDLMTGEDARYVQDVPALAGVSPSVVLMNPPFSSQATTGMAANTSTSFEHVEAALEKLTEGGRLVTVLGAGRDGVDSKQFTAWIRKLKKDYTVCANVVIDGKNYRKYGTDFNVRIVVIDKVGAHTGETVTGTFTNLKELPEKLKGVRDARQSGRAGFESDRSLAGDTGGVRADPRVSGAERAVGDPHAGAGVPVGGGSAGVHDGTHGGGGGSASRGAVSDPHDRAAGERDVEQPRSQRTGRSGESDADRVRAGAGSPASGHEGSGGGDAGQLRGVDQRRGDARAEDVTAPAPESVPASESAPAPAKDYKAGTPKKKPKDTGVYSDYVAPALPVKGLKAHPAVLVESSAMASVQAPKATYKPHLPQDAINRGVWSGEQMVNIVYAGQAHEQTLPNGTRKGYLIGDGTGVGKGRQIAGIIMDNRAQGRKRAVWVSNNSPLYEDAIRDWTAVGGDKADVMLYERSKADKRAGKDGILFTTYSTLGVKPKSGSKDMTTNLDKIVAWLGEDFDGVIAFDEAHNMANAIPKKGGWGQQKPAAKALAGLELQRRLPKARVVYVSATAATSVGELAYAERLGLWGEGTSFRDRETFLDKLMQAGTAGMELVARDMKAMGVYNARSISYDGVQYDTLRHKLTRQQKDMYDKMSDAWQIVMQNVENAMVVTGAVKDGKARGRYLSGLYGSQQRFYQQILCALSMPSVIEDIQRELDAGHSCVLQIVNTNEAQENRTKAAAKETDADLEELDFSPRNILIDYLTNAFPVTRYEEYMDEDGNKRSREVKGADGNPVISQKAVAMRDDLISQIQALSIPDNPLDMLYRAFGVDNVAEITGRSSRVVPLPDEHGEMHLVDQKRGKAANSADVEAFQNGDKRILVFSDAGGTGKSYHADRAAKNQQKRIHYLIQPGWNATKAVQGFGRTHRSNQVSAPTYKLVTTDISGQARFISTIAKRLDNLGAMTKGQRQAGSGFFSAADNLESDLAAQTLFTFYRMLDRGAYPEFSGRSIIRKLGLERKLYTQEGTLNIEASDMMDVSLFLNRVLSLRFDEQNALFGHFVDLLTQFTEEAEQRGELDRGMENVRADRAELVDEKIIRDYENGGEPTKFLRIKTYTKARIEPCVKRIQKTANDFLGIYRDTKGQARAIFALADKTEMNGAVTKRYRVQSPNVGRHGVIDGATLRKYTRVSTDDMEAAWDEAVAAMPEYDVRDTYMVTGALLPIWDRLSDANIKVQRITLDSGERYLGRVINQTQADQLLRQFGQSRKAEKLTGEQIVNTVIGEGRVVTVEKMYSGYELERARVSGENRIEIVGKRRQQAMYDMAGVIEEKIGSEYRYFIPVGEKGAAMLDKLIRDGARVSVKEESGETGIRARKIAKKHDSSDEYSTYGVHWGIAIGVMTTKNARNVWDAIAEINKLGYNSYRTTVDGDYYIESDNLLMIVDADFQKPLIKTIFRFNDEYETNIWVAKERIIDAKGNESAIKEACEIIEAVFGEGYVERFDYPVGRSHEGKNGRGEGGIRRRIDSENRGREGIDATHTETGTGTDFDENTNEGESNRPESFSREDHAGPVTRSELAQFIKERFGVQITFGHMTEKGAEGQYNPKTGGMRIRKPGDVETIAHELGHHLVRNFSLNDKLFGSFGDLLRGLVPADVKDSYKQSELPEEGFAEFLTRYLMNRGHAELQFGRDAEGKVSEDSLFYRFEAALDKRTLADLKEAAIAAEALTEGKNYAEMHIIARDRPYHGHFLLDVAKAYREGVELDGKKRFRSATEAILDTATVHMSEGDLQSRHDAALLFRECWVDGAAMIEDICRHAGDGNADAYIHAINAAYSTSRAERILMGDKLTDMEGRIVGEGLSPILESLYDKTKQVKIPLTGKTVTLHGRFLNLARYDRFGEYLVLKHAPERMAEGMTVHADERITPEYCATRCAEIEAEFPEFADMAARLYAYQTNVLKAWAVQTGIVSAEAAEEWAKRWAFYVPFKRDMTDRMKPGSNRVRDTFANQKNPFRRAVGSTRDIIHPIHSIMQTTVQLVMISNKNRVCLSLTEALKGNENSALLMEKIPLHHGRDHVNTEKAKEGGLNDLMTVAATKVGTGKQTAEEAASDVTEIMEIIDSYFENEMNRFYVERTPRTAQEITVLRKGKAELWRVNDPALFREIAGMSKEAMGRTVRLWSRVVRFQTSALTGANLLWSLRSNVARDFQSAMVFLQKNGKGIKGIAGAFRDLVKGYIASLRYLSAERMGRAPKVWKDGFNADFEEFLALGAAGGSVWAGDKALSRNTLKRMGNKAWSDKFNILGWINTLSTAIELGPRYAEYHLSKQLGATSAVAFYRSMDLTTNFSKGGRLAREINKFIPFFNASIQGINRFVRYYIAADVGVDGKFVHGEARRKLIVQRATGLVMATVIGAALSQLLRLSDKEDYDRLSNYTKLNYWCIPVPFDGLGLSEHEFITISKPRELAVLESTLSFFADYAFGKDWADGDLGDWWEYFSGTVAPPIIGDLLQIPSDGIEESGFNILGSIGVVGPLIEVFANRNFLGQPIIPTYLEDVLPEDQYKQDTSLVAYWLGQAFGLSPAKLDHLAEGILGGYWEWHKTLFPKGGWDYADPSLGFRSNLIRNSAYSTDVANRLYDGREAAMLAYNSDPEDLDKKITYKWYETATSFYSRYGKLAKATEDGKQAEDDRLRALEHVESFLSVMESGGKVAGQDELEAYVRVTGDTSVMPGVMQTFIKYGENGAFDEELILDAKEYIEFQGKYNDLYWKYAAKALAGNLTEEQRGEALQVARDQALIEAKNYILGLHGYSSKRYRQTTGYDDVKSAGVSLTDYAKVKQFWREAESDKDRNGQTVSSSKRDKVAEYIDSLRISDRKKDALYLAMGYSESTLKDAPWH